MTEFERCIKLLDSCIDIIEQENAKLREEQESLSTELTLIRAEKAKKPFGILSVPCDGYDDCRQICLNTIRNNRKRYAEWGHKSFPDYLTFLQSRYAPTENATNDPLGLNRNWLKNVKWFLENPKEKMNLDDER